MDQVETKRRANLLFAQRAYSESRLLFEEMIRRWPDLKDGYVGLAKVLSVSAEPDEIVAALEPVADRFSSFSFASALAGAHRALYFRGVRTSRDSAVRYSEQALADRFDPVIAWYLAEIFLAEREYQQAARLFEQCVPHDKEANAKLLICYKHLGLFQKVKELSATGA